MPAPRDAGHAGRAWLLAAVAVAAVVVGLYSVSPALGIVTAVLLVPAWAVTSAGARRSLARGAPMSRFQKVVVFVFTFITAGVVAVVGAALVVIALVIAVFIACMVSMR